MTPWRWLKNVLVGIDQLLNTVLLGWPDETFSSRCWRWSRDGVTDIPRMVVDAILFIDRNHCRGSHESEMLRRQMPPELRQDVGA